FTLKDLGYEFPRYPVPEGSSEMQFLRERTFEGMIARYGADDPAARRQIERELALIEKLKLPGYFLIVWDIIRFCREHNILVQGRGSAANSAVCYALGITAVDPVKMKLLFERFLSEERGEWPDIDLDLPRGHDRQRDHLSRALRRARDRKGAGLRSRNPGPARQAGGKLGVQGRERYARAPVQKCRIRSSASQNPQISRAVPSGSGPAAPPRPAFRRNGGLPGATGFRGATRTGNDAQSRGRAMGQGRLRRYGHREN